MRTRIRLLRLPPSWLPSGLLSSFPRGLLSGLLIAFLSATTSAAAQPEPPPPPPSLWLESGLAYRDGETARLTPHLRVGIRGVRPLSDTTALYAAFAIDGDLLLDLGGWYSFLPDADDLFGFRSYAGTGLSYAAGSLGVALSGAVVYEFSPRTAFLVVYTHRPLFTPALGQAFDVSVGVRVTSP